MGGHPNPALVRGRPLELITFCSLWVAAWPKHPEGRSKFIAFGFLLREEPALEGKVAGLSSFLIVAVLRRRSRSGGGASNAAVLHTLSGRAMRS
jgi:hypothetical protein